MNIQAKLIRGFNRRIFRVTVITLLTIVGVIMNVNTLSLDSTRHAATTTRQSQLNGSSSSDLNSFKIMRVTAYNVGDPSQTDRTPCIGANNQNLCHALARGKSICAANFVPLNTYLYILNFGVCRVADRLNRRFENRVDIAMPAHQQHRAKKFGVKYLAVKVVP